MANVHVFAPKGASSAVPAYDPRNPAHRAAWESMWTFARTSLTHDRVAATIDLLDLADGDSDFEDDTEREDDDPDHAIEDVPHDAEEDCCGAGDDGCGPIWRHGHIVWGYAGRE